MWDVHDSLAETAWLRVVPCLEVLESQLWGVDTVQLVESMAKALTLQDFIETMRLAGCTGLAYAPGETRPFLAGVLVRHTLYKIGEGDQRKVDIAGHLVDLYFVHVYVNARLAEKTVDCCARAQIECLVLLSELLEHCKKMIEEYCVTTDLVRRRFLGAG